MIKIHSHLQLLAASALICTAMVVGFPSDTSALSIVHCAGRHASEHGTGADKTAGLRQIDPIVERGNPMSMHEHQFFGFTDWDTIGNPSMANYADLLGGNTSCDLPQDSAAYWSPVMRTNKGSAIRIQRMESYYRPWNSGKVDNKSLTQVMPADLRMVTGNAKATSAKDVNRKNITWSCGNFSSKAQRLGHMYPSPIEADCSTATGRVFLTVAARFPSCWDGKLNDHKTAGNTADYSGSVPAPVVQHLAYPVKGNCPAGFSIKLPELTVNTSWDYRGNGKDIKLSSGNIYSYHTDFWNAWDPDFFRKMVNTCINTSVTRVDEPSLHVNHPETCGPPVKKPK